MGKKRAISNTIIVAANGLAGKVVDLTGMQDGDGIKFDEPGNKFVPAQFASTDHDHEIGDMVVVFENGLI